MVIGAQGVSAGRAELQAGVIVRTRQIGIGTCGAYLVKQLICIKKTGASPDQDMLAKDILRTWAFWFPVQIVINDGLQGRLTLHHFEAICRHQKRLGGGVVIVIGPPDALHQTFDVFGRANLNDEIHIPPIDAQIERTGADNGAQFAALHGTLHTFPLDPIERAMMDPDWQGVFVGKPQIVKENLCLGAGVVKNEGRLMRTDLVEDIWNGIDRAPARPWRWIRGLEHRNIRGRARIGHQDLTRIGVARQQMRDGRRVFDRGGETDAAQAGRIFTAEGFQPAQSQHHLIAAFGFAQRMDFINDDALQTGKHAVRVFIRGEKREALRRGQQDMRRIGALTFLAALRCVTRAIVNADGQGHLFDRGAQIAFYVGRERFERGDVKRVDPFMRAVFKLHQRWQETGQRFAAAGWRNQQLARLILAVEHVLLMGVDLPAASGKPILKPKGERRHGALPSAIARPMQSKSDGAIAKKLGGPRVTGKDA